MSSARGWFRLLAAAAARGWHRLAADVALVSDTWMLGDGRPRLRRHLHAAMPAGVRGRLVIGSSAPPYTLDQRAPVLRAVRGACRGVFGWAPVLLPSGGSIPVVGALAAASPIDIALLGFGLPDDAAHAANERFYLPNLWRGTQACIALYQHLGLPGGNRATRRRWGYPYHGPAWPHHGTRLPGPAQWRGEQRESQPCGRRPARASGRHG